ncbi:hypothetical protein WK81_27150 [Burkholderia ubonensis]|nr:hypothetical protein WK81_27150 [Burkholderia ubonensis]
MIDLHPLKDSGNLYAPSNYSITTVGSWFAFIKYSDVILGNSIEQSIQGSRIGRLQMLFFREKMIGLGNLAGQTILDILHHQSPGGGRFLDDAFHKEINDSLVRPRFTWTLEIMSRY